MGYPVYYTLSLSKAVGHMLEDHEIHRNDLAFRVSDLGVLCG